MNLLKKNIKKFFLSVYWYESLGQKNTSIKKNNFKLLVIKSKHAIKENILDNYFKKHPSKLERLKKRYYFLVLINKKKILSSGWIYFGSRWKITEIEKSIPLENRTLLFDFETPRQLRNRGYYRLLLKLIRRKFVNKKLAIYSLSNNTRSNRAIKKAGFKFIKKIHGLRN